MPDYGKEYFESVSTGPGENGLKYNTCKLLDFKLLVLNAAESRTFSSDGREVGLVILTGLADISVNGEMFKAVGGRKTVFEGPPSMVYAPAGAKVVISASSNCQVALCSCPASAALQPYRVDPDDCYKGGWGNYNTSRTYNYMIRGTRPSECLQLAEVTVESGNWATYPPHKHDETRPDLGEVFQEEMYYYRTDQPAGFGFCASYGGKADDDYAFMVRNNTIHKMPAGYHTVCAAPGYKVWYLALIAGHDKRHSVFVDPDHDWYLKAETALANIRRQQGAGAVR